MASGSGRSSRRAVPCRSTAIASTSGLPVRQTPFPEPVVETTYATSLAARTALVEQLRRPLGSLPEADRAFIDELLAETLDKTVIADRVRERLQTKRKEG